MIRKLRGWLLRLRNVLVDSPGLLANVVVAVAALAAALGFVVNGEEVEAIVTAIFSISSTLAGLYGREQTVPVERVQKYRTQDGRFVQPHK